MDLVGTTRRLATSAISVGSAVVGHPWAALAVWALPVLLAVVDRVTMIILMRMVEQGERVEAIKALSAALPAVGRRPKKLRAKK